MNLYKLSMPLLLLLFADNAAAYGSSSSTKSCKKPSFSQFSPPASTSVKPGDEFSFIASANTLSGSIKVIIKKQPVKINISKKGTQHKVTGKLPETMKGSYARINITARTNTKCNGSDGWLLKITE